MLTCQCDKPGKVKVPSLLPNMLLLSSPTTSSSGNTQQKKKGTREAMEEVWAAGAVGDMETPEDKAGGSRKEALVR